MTEWLLHVIISCLSRGWATQPSRNLWENKWKKETESSQIDRKQKTLPTAFLKHHVYKGHERKSVQSASSVGAVYESQIIDSEEGYC
jgi:hypothetical protein